MQSMIRRLALFALSLSCGACFGGRYSTPIDRSHDPKFLINRDSAGLALQGYDPVAYFTDQKPIEGNSKYRMKHEGAWYQFASQEHLDLFAKDPHRYVPQFGGYCGYAVSIDKLSPIDPHFWQVLDGRLVLQHNERAWKAWNEDVAGNLKKADQNWPGLRDRNAQPEKVLVNVDAMGLALEGHDPVAYFSDNKPVAGDPMITAIYNGAMYRFTSVEHKNTFEKDPAKYAPAFGGFCGYAASIHKVSPVNIHLFQIIDGRLVLQHTDEAFRLFNEDANRNLSKADHNWPSLVENHGS